MKFSTLLQHIVSEPQLHAKWLNTLSLMENTGARKTSAGEDKTNVPLLVLKHAAEEHRHAYYLKKQLNKLGDYLCPTYSNEYLIAPFESRFYLNKLDTTICRYLKTELGLKGKELRFAAYLLVTYAIEVRADELYPVYQQALDAAGSKVNVKSIILEEEGHLEEMIHQLEQFSPQWKTHADEAVKLETALFNSWMQGIKKEIN